MSISHRVELFTRVVVGEYTLRVDWVADAVIGYSIGQYGKIPKSISLSESIESYLIFGELVIAFPCDPGRYCHITCVLIDRTFKEIGGMDLVRVIFRNLQIAPEESYYISISDSTGCHGIEGRAGVRD